MLVAVLRLRGDAAWPFGRASAASLVVALDRSVGALAPADTAVTGATAIEPSTYGLKGVRRRVAQIPGGGGGADVALALRAPSPVALLALADDLTAAVTSGGLQAALATAGLTVESIALRGAPAAASASSVAGAVFGCAVGAAGGQCLADPGKPSLSPGEWVGVAAGVAAALLVAAVVLRALVGRARAAAAAAAAAAGAGPRPALRPPVRMETPAVAAPFWAGLSPKGNKKGEFAVDARAGGSAEVAGVVSHPV